MAWHFLLHQTSTQHPHLRPGGLIAGCCPDCGPASPHALPASRGEPMHSCGELHLWCVPTPPRRAAHFGGSVTCLVSLHPCSSQLTRHSYPGFHRQVCKHLTSKVWTTHCTTEPTPIRMTIAVLIPVACVMVTGTGANTMPAHQHQQCRVHIHTCTNTHPK
jgi:hypothetical protein